MTVAVVDRPELPVASFAWASRAAHDDGTSPNAGLALLTARAIAEGELREEARARLKARGLTGEPPIVASSEGTRFEIVALSPAWKGALSELADVIRSPPLDSDAIAVARRRVAAARDFAATRIANALRQAGLDAVWGKNRPATLSLSSNGSPGTEFSDDRVRRFHALTYRPTDSILVAVGPFDLAEVLTAVNAAFGSWSDPSGAPSAEVLETPPAEPTDDGAHIVGIRTWGPTYVTIASACTGVMDSDDLAFELISQLLRGSTTSGGFRLMRIENPESYYLHANCTERRAAGTFTFDVDSRPEDVQKNADMLLGALGRLRSIWVEGGELTAAKKRFLGLWETRLSTTAGIAHSVAEHFEAGVAPDFFATLESRVRAITPAEVQNVANRYLQPRQLHIVIAGNSPTIGADLARLGRITWVDAAPTRDLPDQLGEGSLEAGSSTP
jgi:predicted Zn-dependent peptidase